MELNTLEELWAAMRKYIPQYEIFRIWFFTGTVIILRHPEDIKVIFSSKNNINKGYTYNNLKLFWRSGLPMSKDVLWRQRRKIVAPAFSSTRIKENAVIVNKYAEKCITYMRSEGDETIQSLLPHFTNFATSTVCEVAMGIDINTSKLEGKEKFTEAIDIVSYVTAYRICRPYIKDWMMNWLPIGWKQNRYIADADKFTNKVIEECRKLFHRTEYTTHDTSVNHIETKENDIDGNRRKPVLDILLLAEQNGLIDSQGISDEVTSFISTGLETTALAISYTVMLLAENKKAQELARNEILETCDQRNGKLINIDTQKLEYLDRCVKESLRLFPVVPHIARCTSEDFQLRDYFIPAKTDIIIDIFDLQRDPNFWPEPEKFDPDRFLPDEIKNRHPFAYIAFGGGIRNCIGMKYGMAAVKTMLAHILYNFYLEPIDKTCDLKFTTAIGLVNTFPVRTKFIKINHEMT